MCGAGGPDPEVVLDMDHAVVCRGEENIWPRRLSSLAEVNTGSDLG